MTGDYEAECTFFQAQAGIWDLPASGVVIYFFFFQAEDGIRDDLVTGVQTCALPIFSASTASTVTSSVSPGLTASRAWRRCLPAPSSLTCSRPSTPGATSTKAPNASEIGRASCRERV